MKRPSAAAIKPTDIIDGPGPRGAEEGLQVGERRFDWIEVGAVRRQEAEQRARLLDCEAHRRLFVGGQIVEYDVIAGRNVGTSTCSTWARNVSVLIGPSNTAGATSSVGAGWSRSSVVPPSATACP
jgi:hypothetical protein